jgi:hypothetical protein
VRLLTKGRKVRLHPGHPDLPIIEKIFPGWEKLPEFIQDGGVHYRLGTDGEYHYLRVYDTQYMPLLIHFHAEGDIDDYVTFCDKDNRGGHWGSVTDDWDHVTCPHCREKANHGLTSCP